MGDTEGGFAEQDVEHEGAEQETAEPSFAELTGVEPPMQAPLEDGAVGGGSLDAILQAFPPDEAPMALPELDTMHADVVKPAPKAAKPAPKPAAKKPAAPPPPPAPKKQRYDFQKVKDTTDGKPGGYDIGWMKKVDSRVLKSIDGQYADDLGEAKVQAAITNDRKLKDIEKNRKAREAALRKQNGTVAPKGKPAPFDLTVAISDYGAELARNGREEEVREQVENNARRSQGNQTVAVPGQGTVRRADMQSLKRINYNSDLTSLSNDPAKTRKYIESMRAAKGTDTRKVKGKEEKNPHAMILGGDTADRFDMARDEFAKDHAGFSIPTTGNAFATRGMHEERWGLGMLGHVLGTSFDLHAVENPNLKGPDGEVGGVNDYMLKQMSEKADPTHSGRVRMDMIKDDKIEAMGKRTASGTNNAEDAALETQIRTQYRETSQTSKNVRQAFTPDEMKALRGTQQEFFKSEEERKAIAKALKAAGGVPDEALQERMDLNTAEHERIVDVLRDTFADQQADAIADKAAALERHKTDTNPKHDATWKANELAVLDKAHAAYEDPSRIFGTYSNKGGVLAADENKVSNVSMMQYLSKGFAKDDGTNYEQLKKDGKQGQVFNEDVVVELMKHGFNSGSYFGDTMHFDFIEAQSNFVPGGRSTVNSRKDRASPENTLPDVVNVPTTPVPKAQSPTFMTDDPYDHLRLPKSMLEQ